MPETARLRVLAVEDSPDDVELITGALRSGGYTPSVLRVETRDEMLGALVKEPWDVILADYRLPEFTGIDAIALVRTENLDIPVIVVSGTIGEGAAIEAMRAGADDYVLKADLRRLPGAVRVQQQEAQERRRWREAENVRRRADEQRAQEAQTRSDALALLCRRVFYIGERLESDPPLDERAQLLQALRSSATAAMELVKDLP